MHDGSDLSTWQYQTQFSNFLTPPGGGNPASVLYTYQGSSTTDVNVPLYDISGSTIALVNASNPSAPIVTNYTYDPNGIPTTSSSRTPWPFLWSGLEQEYPDSWKLYYEPDGNIYNPDPFQLSLQGPQGLDVAGGGGGPRSLGGYRGDQSANWAEDAFDVVTGIIDSFGGISGNDPPFRFFLSPFDLLFGGSSQPSISFYDLIRTQHASHPVYCEVLGICGVIVTQQGNITLAQSDEDEKEKEVEGDLGLSRIFEGKRPVIPSGGLLVPTEVGTFTIPEGSEIGPARNGRGYRFRTGKANPEEIRIMGPDPEHGYPDGYVRFYFKNQPVNPNTGKPVSDAEGHYKILP